MILQYAFLSIVTHQWTSVREHLAYREQFINVISNGKYLDSFWTPKHFGQFLDNICGYFWTSDWTGFDKYPNLTPLVGMYYAGKINTHLIALIATTLLLCLEETSMDMRIPIYFTLTCYTRPDPSHCLRVIPPLSCQRRRWRALFYVATNGNSR